jgi:hypothetical protein
MPPRNAKFPNFPEQVSALYQDAVDNLRFSKQQQWNITYYALLVYAAVFVLQDEAVFLTHRDKVFLTIIAGFGFLFSVFMLCDLQDRMKTFRGRIDRVHEEYLTAKQRSALDLVPNCRWQDCVILVSLLSHRSPVLRRRSCSYGKALKRFIR